MNDKELEEYIGKKIKHIPNFIIKQKRIKNKGIRFKLHNDWTLIIQLGKRNSNNSTFGWIDLIRLESEQTQLLFSILNKRDKLDVFLHELIQKK